MEGLLDLLLIGWKDNEVGVGLSDVIDVKYGEVENLRLEINMCRFFSYI